MCAPTSPWSRAIATRRRQNNSGPADGADWAQAPLDFSFRVTMMIIDVGGCAGLPSLLVSVMERRVSALLPWPSSGAVLLGAALASAV